MTTEMIIGTFENDATKALEALQRLREVKEAGELEIPQATAVSYPVDGKPEIENLGGKETKRGAVYGAITGGLLGMLGGPLVAVAGAVAGATAGDAMRDIREHGISDKLVENIRNGLKPGSSAIIAYVDARAASRAIRYLEERGATVAHEQVDLRGEPPHRSSG